MAERTEGMSAQDVAMLETVLDPDYPERLREVAHHLFDALLREDSLRGLDRRVLAEMALKQTEHLSMEMGGGNFYMHKGLAFRLTLRDREMCRKFNGRNYGALAKEYNLSEMRIRQIIDAWQREEFARRQAGLFGGDQGLSENRA
jgi:Mor family transcriptional regulator